LSASSNIVREIKTKGVRLEGHVERMGEMRNAYNIFVGKPEGKIPLRRPRRRWEDNIRMHVGEIVRGDVDWMHLTQDRDPYEHGNELQVP